MENSNKAFTSFPFSYSINTRRETGQFVMKFRNISFSIKQTYKSLWLLLIFLHCAEELFSSSRFLVWQVVSKLTGLSR